MIIISGRPLTLAEIESVAHGEPVELAESALHAMAASRAVIERIVAEGKPIYGVNTGFGKLSDIHIPPDQLAQLQLNLVRSHACGVGEPLSIPEARAMLLLRANVLAVGCSGARPVVAEHLVSMLNLDVTPVIPEQGSVGASGDLAPLAHLALAALGEGEAFFRGERMGGAEALAHAGLSPLTLEAKEGLALLNGTQAMGAVASIAVGRAKKAMGALDVAGAMSLDAVLGTPAAFDPRIQQVRPHQGQIEVAAHLTSLLEGSEIRESHREGDTRVQDAYCLRCMPQVHGAARDVLRHVASILEIESGAATDNPLVFVGNGDVISGGNFHGAPLAYAFDYAAIALTDMASISERRVDRLVNPDVNEHLPPFLAKIPGTESGLMMAHVTVAALLNECKVLSHPASVDSVPTSGGKEDHVSMGMTAALKLRKIVLNLERIAAIELITASQALSFREPLRTSWRLRDAREIVVRYAPGIGTDRSLTPEVEAVSTAIRDGSFEAF